MAEVPTVSVVITTFNRLRLLQRAIATVEQQTLRGFEIIVLDDGSTDGTREYLDGYDGSASLRYEFHEGIERARLRNRGADIARADLITFLDDDDEWEPTKLEEQVRAMKSATGTAATYCFTTAIDDDGVPLESLTAEHLETYQQVARSGHSFESLLDRMLIFTSCLMVRRSAFVEVGGYDTRFVPAEDWHLYLRLATKHRIAVIPKSLVRYRVHSANFTTGSGTKKLQRLSAARVAAAEDLLEGSRRDQPSDRRTHALLLRFIAMNQFWAGNNRAALRASWRAFSASASAIKPSDILSWIPRALVKSVRADAA